MEVIGGSTGSSGTSTISGSLPDTAGADLAATHADADTLAATVSGGKVLVTETSAAAVLTQATKLANAVATTSSAAPATGELVMGETPGATALPIQLDATGRTIVVGPGTAGSPAGGVVSVQGVSGGTAMATSDATLDATVVGGAVKTSDAALDATVVGGAVKTSDAALDATVVGGAVKTSDATLDATVVGGAVKTSDATLDATVSGGAVVTKPQAGSIFNTTSLLTAGAQVVAGPRVFFYAVFINYGGATLGVAYFNATSTQSGGAIPVLISGPEPNNSLIQTNVGGIGLLFSAGIWAQGTPSVAFTPAGISLGSISISYE